MISHLGRYEIMEELGQGAMGVVYKAYDPLIERFVAIKTINLQVLSEKEKIDYEARFFQEAKAAGHLNHPNIVTIHDLGESGDIAYIAMELMEGRELQEIIDSKQHLSLEESLNIAAQVAAGLFYAHQHGIVHRDIKPSNIMVLGNNHAKIADFGIARMASSLSRTKTGMIIGSPLYMSPEQISSHPVDFRSDIFSFGIVLYQLLTGQLPFSGDNANSVMYQIINETPKKPSLLNPDIPPALDDVVFKCLAKNPQERYISANELADDLRSCREAIARTKSGLDHPFLTGKPFRHLQRLAVPGGISPNFVALGSFILMGLIFAVDMATDTRIQLHMLYIFPLILISYHYERIRVVGTAVLLSLFLQGIMLMSNDLSLLAKLTLAILVLPSNIAIAYVSRIARINFLEVAQLSSFDNLTGLRNRLSFESITDIEIERQKRQGGLLSFAFVDLDNFKELNEASGFAAGDQALKLIANVLRENIRQFDTAARIGGDEFAILMPNTQAADCDELCRQISGKISAQMAAASLDVSASIGHTTFEQAPASISEVFNKAERAMHVAQTSGYGGIASG